MSTIVDHLRRDAARVYRLVDQVRAFVAEHEGVRSYPAESREFLKFVVHAAESTKRFLEERIAEVGTSQEPTLSDPRLPSRIAFVSEIWGKLHNCVKPVADAHTLRIPIALVRLLNRQAQDILQPETARVAIELASPLNYLQRKHSPLRNLATLLENRLGTHAKFEFPRGLGIIGLPYSQGPFLFFNCLLYHELGHYYFEQRNLSGKLKKRVFGKIEQTFAGEIKAGKDPEKFFKIARPWYEEVFCDLFAVRLVGPAYLFIFAELFDLIGDLRNKKAALFSRSHPSASIRLEQQILLLKGAHAAGDDKRTWWNILSDANVPLLAEIMQVAEEPLPANPYQGDCEGVPPQLVEAFKNALPAVSDFVSGEMKGRYVPVEYFDKLRRKLEACLLHGIVPSCVDAEGVAVDDWCTALINVAYFLQLGDLDCLFRVSQRDKFAIENHAQLRKRIEQWALKAIEDVIPVES